MAVDYAKEREQFDRPIGAYQAVSHRLAEMLWDVEEARSLTYYAAWAADAEPESLPLAASMAKARASDAADSVTHNAIQTFGGIGFTWEHDIHFLLKRARVPAAWHRRQHASAPLRARRAGAAAGLAAAQCGPRRPRPQTTVAAATMVRRTIPDRSNTATLCDLDVADRRGPAVSAVELRLVAFAVGAEAQRAQATGSRSPSALDRLPNTAEARMLSPSRSRPSNTILGRISIGTISETSSTLPPRHLDVDVSFLR